MLRAYLNLLDGVAKRIFRGCIEGSQPKSRASFGCKSIFLIAAREDRARNAPLQALEGCARFRLSRRFVSTNLFPHSHNRFTKKEQVLAQENVERTATRAAFARSAKDPRPVFALARATGAWQHPRGLQWTKASEML